MKEEIITFETAKLAKEKGFEITWLKDYFDLKDNRQYGQCVVFSPELYSYDDENHIGLSTQSLLQKWLREKHKIAVLVTLCPDNYGYDIIRDESFVEIIKYKRNFLNYENALEEGLQEALKLI